jgi:hypothetical protein
MLRNCCSVEMGCTADLTDIPTACRLITVRKKTQNRRDGNFYVYREICFAVQKT